MQIDPSKLRQALIEYFNETELRNLSFDLGVTYDALRGSGTAEKSRELVDYFLRRQRVEVLVTAVLEQREALTREAISSKQVEVTDSSISLLPQADKSNTLIAGKSITALIRLMRQPEVRTAVVAFQTTFEAASAQIDLMNGYKLLHDLFQELENRYFLIINDQRRLPADETAWDGIELNEPELRAKITDLIEASPQSDDDTAETRWRQQLVKVQENVRSGVEQFDLSLLQSGTRLLYRILNRQPSRINAQLLATAAALRLDALEEAMLTISQGLANTNLELEAINQIQDGVNALSGLDGRVNSLVKEHNGWQAIDDELRRVEGSLPQGIEELEDAWLDLEPMTRNQINGHEGDWVGVISQSVSDLGQALDGGANVSVRRHFRRFRSQVGRRFRRVDFELLSLSQELQKVGESLDLLLRNFR